MKESNPVKLSEEAFVDMGILFGMLKDPTRLKIMYALLEDVTKQRCVSELVESLHMSQSAISHQLALLKKTKLVKSRKDGKNVYYSLSDRHVESIFQMAMEHVLEK